ncbi:MAG: aromatic amino acid lyase [Methyloprofundus sp.]|nr:aromatic amino acid lyase [Methyloprofundus sp.]
MNHLILNGRDLTIKQIVAHVSDNKATIELSEHSWEAIACSSKACDAIVDNKIPCYGINLGFGEMVDIEISPEHIENLQKSLILSHAVGVKDALPESIARTIFLLRLNSLSRGASGIRPRTMQDLIYLYNNRAYPEIYRAGSLGASGDLGPLSHLAAFAIGEGWGYLNGQRIRVSEIFTRLKLKPLVLARKEGLAMINGTSAMSAIAIHAVHQLQLYLDMMLLGMAMFADSQHVPTDFLNTAAMKLKPHPGSDYIVEHLNCLLKDVKQNDQTKNHLFQQVYSIRCTPFILAPLVDSLKSTLNTLTIEANSVSDNPIFINGEDYPYHGGHFHGMPVSVSLDQLRIAVVHLSGVMDRQLEFFIDRKRNLGVNPFFALKPDEGHCGLEGAQYLVTSLHIENKALSNSFSTMVLPANAGNQDYVSMGMQSALSTLQMAENLKFITGVYLFAALQAYSLKEAPPSGAALTQACSNLSKDFSFPYVDNLLLSEQIKSFASNKRFTQCQSELYKALPELLANSL